jgi:hypothetical protein
MIIVAVVLLLSANVMTSAERMLQQGPESRGSSIIESLRGSSSSNSSSSFGSTLPGQERLLDNKKKG